MPDDLAPAIESSFGVHNEEEHELCNPATICSEDLNKHAPTAQMSCPPEMSYPSEL
jgi:hypothetical protein